MNTTEWHQLRTDLLKTLYPPKSVYRKVGVRKGRNVYAKCGWEVAGKFFRLKRTPYLQVQLKYSDPFKQRSARGLAKRVRQIRRSTQWYDKPGSFLKNLFGL